MVLRFWRFVIFWWPPVLFY